MENAGEILSAATGLLFNNYTGVLLGATVIPAWNRNVSSLPVHFSVSGAGAAVSGGQAARTNAAGAPAEGERAGL